MYFWWNEEVGSHFGNCIYIIISTNILFYFGYMFNSKMCITDSINFVVG